DADIEATIAAAEIAMSKLK
ncbi:hypothetical protein, partial [Bacillus thuringiensis]